MPTDIPDDEILYRRVLPAKRHVVREGNGYRISATAFDDANQKPSVDLSSIADADLGGPSWTQEGEVNGVLKLRTGAVREATQRGKVQRPKDVAAPPNAPKLIDIVHEIDVYRDPIKDPKDGERVNPAHAEIRPTPECGGSVFKRLKEALQRIAQIEILPEDVR